MLVSADAARLPPSPPPYTRLPLRSIWPRPDKNCKDPIITSDDCDTLGPLPCDCWKDSSTMALLYAMKERGAFRVGRVPSTPGSKALLLPAPGEMPLGFPRWQCVSLSARLNISTAEPLRQDV